MKAVSKEVDGYEVYQTDQMVAVQLGKGHGSVIAARHCSNQSAASRIYNRLDDKISVQEFTHQNPAAWLT